MAVLAGGYGSWQHHVGEDNRRKARDLTERVEHLENAISELQRQVAELQATRDEALAGAV